MIEKRIELLKQMNNYILTECQNELAIDYWFTYGIPDEATEDDFEYIAQEEGFGLFTDVCIAFANVLKFIK